MAEDKNKGAATAAPTFEQEVQALKETVAALKAENADLKAELKDAAEIVADLKEKVNAAKGKKVNTVSVAGSTYMVVGGFVKAGKAYKAEDIAADKKLAEELIKKQSGLIVKIK